MIRVFIKILLFPVSIVLTIFCAISEFLVVKCAILLNIVSGLLFIGVLAMSARYFWGWPSGTPGESQDLFTIVFVGVLSFLISPFGLPRLAIWIISKLANLNELIKSI